MENKFLKLTDTVYKVLEFFPESDPLKNRAKDKALAIMDNLVLINETSGWTSFQKEKIKVHLFEDVDILLGYLWIAKSQSWLNSANFLIISNEYEKIKNEIGPVIELTKTSPESVLITRRDADKESAPIFFNLSDRQKKILEFLSKNEKAQVMDLQGILPNITKRTIRRDMDQLLQMGKIERLGDFNNVSYRAKR